METVNRKGKWKRLDIASDLVHCDRSGRRGSSEKNYTHRDTRNSMKQKSKDTWNEIRGSRENLK